ncbi:MAG: NPCBM/NEW2 domain-containing protein, partial [Planctomycetota bacterium]
MTRAGALLLAFAAAAAAAPSVSFLDGKEVEGARLLEAGPGEARIETSAGIWTVPTRNLAAARWDAPPAAAAGAPNLYLLGGDALRGTVRGEGAEVVLDGMGVAGFRAPLASVAAVRFGRLLGATQAAYEEAFQGLRAQGKDAVLVQRETRPFPLDARVIAVGDTSLRVRIGDAVHDLDAPRVYGFVRARDGAEPPPPPPLAVRFHLAGGGRATLPLESIDGAFLRGGGATVARDQVERVEFLGEHVAHLGDLDPVSVDQAALFGRARPWRRDAMVLGGPLRMRGVVYSRGLGVQARSRVEFALGGRWRSFFCRCGIDDAAGQEGDALFRIVADGKTLHEIRQRRQDAPVTVLLGVEGVDRLALEADPGEAWASDLCD